jgi:hypothetical protein
MFVYALGQVAQWIELLTTDQKAGGSNPSLLTAILITSNPLGVGCCCFGKFEHSSLTMEGQSMGME